MEFQWQYMRLMQERNPKLYRRLRDSGELDRMVNLKAQEAHRLYEHIMADKPNTLQNQRETEEVVKGIMFEFPDDLDSPKMDER